MTERKDIEVSDEIGKIEDYAHLSESVMKKLEWFKDQKLGVIFHWGLYAKAGIVESWQLSEEDDWARGENPWRPTVEQIRKEYWGLNKQFDPIKFNPKAWAALCKKAGFNYMIFTTKHHDGFNMYDTQYSDYKITSADCPYHTDPKADVFKEITNAFKEEGLAIGAYYSKADWYSPYYWVPGQHAKGRTASYNPLDDPITWGKFKGFVHNQLEEIVENYGPLDIVWLDAGWVREGRTHEDLDMDALAGKLRKHQPDLLIVDRSVSGVHENYVTPERKIPENPPVKVWESNIPHANNWGYVPNDLYKSNEEMIESIIKVVALGGNLIIGVGPKPDGTLPRESVEMLEALGKWINLFGEGIYGTRPYKYNIVNNWFLTQKGNNVYAYVIPDEKNKHNELDLLDIELENVAQAIDMRSGELVELNNGKIRNNAQTIQGYKLLKK